MSKAQRVEIYDTTLRDGMQAEGVSLSLEDKLDIAVALDALGVDYIEGGYPLSNPKDEQFFAQIADRGLKHSKVTAFGMTRRKAVAPDNDKGLAALLASEAPVITIVGKSWDMHVRDVLKADQDENLSMIADSVAHCTGAGREVIFDAEHFFDGWRDNPAYALATLRAAADAGAGCLVLCDTNGGSLPGQITDAVSAAAKEMSGVKLGIHCHNDCDLAVANSLAAVEAGARHVQGTINGIGERCGNADLTAVVPNLALKCGYDVLRSDTLRRITEISRYIYEVANLNFRENQPFVGSAAFCHKGGMHVHAVQLNTATYEHIRPEDVGNSRRILVSELSGMSNISATAPGKFNIAGDKAAQQKVLAKLSKMENEGYQFEAAEASFELLIRKTLGGKWYRRLWELDHYRCIILRRGGGDAGTEATVKIRLNGTSEHRVAEGEGPVDSLHEALCAALRPHYACVDDLHLADYKVRIVNTSAETAAKVRVVIEWHDPAAEAAGMSGYFGSVGVSENIIDASWLAITDAIEYKLLADPACGVGKAGKE